jgi:hypothetical protein
MIRRAATDDRTSDAGADILPYHLNFRGSAPYRGKPRESSPVEDDAKLRRKHPPSSALPTISESTLALRLGTLARYNSAHRWP